MAIKQIITIPDPVLRKLSKPVEHFDDELQKLLDDMLETMYEAPGIGLAAVQIGIPLRLVTIDVSPRQDSEISSQQDGEMLPQQDDEVLSQQNDRRDVIETEETILPESYKTIKSGESTTTEAHKAVKAEESISPKSNNTIQTEEPASPKSCENTETSDCATKTKQPLFMINPEIINYSDQPSTYEEGCLSIPEYYAEVERPASCRVKYLDRYGKQNIIQADGILSTCIQHEIDHLDGVLFIDYLSKLKRNMVLKKFNKIVKKSTII